MILFKSIKWKNFLSTGNTFVEIDLRKSQLTLMIGANGSGKSTMLDALCFALFNRPFRLIKKEQIVNTINNGDTVVELEFQIGTKMFKIIRGIKPNIFEIYSDGVLLNQDASSIDYQNVLEDQILRLNYRAFKQIAVLGSSSYQPFMQMRPRHRREVVEEILDIRVFSHMDLLLRTKQGELTKSVVDVKHRYDLMTEKYELQKKHFEQIQSRDNSDIEDKKQQLEENKKHNQQYSEQLQKLNEEIILTKEQIRDKEEVDKKANQLSKLEAKIETNLLNHKKNLEFFQENETCPTCTQQLEPTFRGEKIAYEKGKVTTLEDGLKGLLDEIVKTETRINEMAKVSEKITNLNIEIAKVNTSLTEINRYSNRLNDEIIKLETDKKNTDNVAFELEQIKEQLKQVNVEKEKVVEEKKYIDIAREILNDTGVKAKIIKKYLPIMNQLINKYLQAMDFFVNFHLDEEFNETIKSRFRDTFNYNSFSEGEKLRIDLALLFTWRTIAKMKNSTNTNLLILDEVFDSSLDNAGTEDFFKILKELTNENTFIISHKGDIMFDKFTNIIKFEKYKNFTRIV